MYYEKIKKLLHEEYGIQNFDSNTKFSELGLDSLDKVEIIMYLEEEFNIEITDEEGDNVNTVKDLVELIQNKKN
jgi:acyl carrier protein